MIALDVEGHRVFPQLDLPGVPMMWAHCGDSHRSGAYPGCRAVTWMVDGYDPTPVPGQRKAPEPTEPTFRDEDILAIEPDVELRRHVRWRPIQPVPVAP